jgi:ATP-dependent Lon protease
MTKDNTSSLPENNDSIELVTPQEEIIDAGNVLPILPLKNLVTLPTSIIPVIVGRKSSIRAVEKALKHHEKMIFVTTQKDQETENPESADIFHHGTISMILQKMKMPNGSLKILIEGISRAKMIAMHDEKGFKSATVEELPTPEDESKIEVEAAWRQLKSAYTAYAKCNNKIPSDLTSKAKDFVDKDCMTDTIAVHADLSVEDRQEILETVPLTKRMMLVSVILKKELEILEAEQRIKGHVQHQVEKNQREYYLTEQIKAIYKELGKEDQLEEVERFLELIDRLNLPTDALESAMKEIKKLEQTPTMSSESANSKHYLDWICSLPWKKASKDTISLEQATKLLDKHHAGLKKIKERILEFIATKKFAKDLDATPIICLVGPPGVGKTSLATSIATTLGRKFVRISLGGVRDESEIRGHRRTYIGSLPGKIIQAMRKAKTINPVILLDEIDKMSKDSHGDPAAALLEVLDPEQNKTFTDHFMNCEYDLSKVMFITTANMIDTIPYPLYDRMEIVHVAGYTEEEKLGIVKQFLIPKQLKEHALTKKNIKISDDFIKQLMRDYTKEAGVRQLNRLIAKLMRKVIQEILKTKEQCITVTQPLLLTWFGHPDFKLSDVSKDEDKVGLVTGLAWTELGGDVLEIEIAIIPGKGGFTLTGQLGEVMQESAQAAFSYIKSKATELHISKAVFNNKDIHIHIPEGATPKDGPSAGIAMCTALVSALTNIPVKKSVAMTGELTLRGRVLGIGGLKEKLLAAQQYKKTTVIIPKANENDYKEIQKEITGVEVHFAQEMDSILKLVLTADPFVAPKKKAKKTIKKPSAGSKTKKIISSNK